MAPSLFAIVGPSPLAGTLLRISAVSSLALFGIKLSLAKTTTSGIADQPLSAITAPAKAQRLAFYSNAGFFLASALVTLKFSYAGIPSVLDKALYAVLAIQYSAGLIGNYSIGYTGPAVTFAAALLPMLGALAD